MKKDFLIAALLAMGAFMTVCGCATESVHQIGMSNENGSLVAHTGESIAFSYRYEGVPFKPYVQRLFTPDGVNVLLDAPSDHLHHHALMFAVSADGVNFWEEQNKPGRQQHVSFANYVGVGHGDTPNMAGFDEQLSWVNPATGEVLLKELRMLRARQAGNLGATLLTWRSKLEAPPQTESVTLSGSHYFGLGARFVRSMDADGQFQNADGKPGEVFRGEEKLVRSNWCAYTATADGKLVTVAMFGHPENPRHPTTWFTMVKPFAYLSATLSLHEDPLKVISDKPLVLCYGVALWDGRVKSDQIDKVYRWWIDNN
jgi:hypothetical protein